MLIAVVMECCVASYMQSIMVYPIHNPSPQHMDQSWSIHALAEFWAKPKQLRAVAKFLSPTVVAHWPGAAKPLIGPKAYQEKLMELLWVIPNFSVTFCSHYIHNDILTISWQATGHILFGPATMTGTSHLVVSNGIIERCHTLSEHPIFDLLAQDIS